MTDNDAPALIFGATRGTGLEAGRALTRMGIPVAAVVRSSSDTAAIEASGATIITANIFNAHEIDSILDANNYSAVVLSLSGKKGEAKRADREGAQKIIDAANQHGVSRVLMVTAIGCGASRDIMAPKVIEVLGEVLEAKTTAENYLQDSGLEYTIIRPGGLTNDPASGTAIKTTDQTVMGVAHRADVGQLVADCLADRESIGKIYHAVDPEIKWQPPLQRGEDPDNSVK